MIEKILEFWEEYKTKIIISVLVGAIGMVVFWPISNQKTDSKQTDDNFSEYDSKKFSTMSFERSFSINSLSNEIYVDVKGAVKNPGAYQLGMNQRVGNAIEKAGGFIDGADSNRINLAKKLTDQMVIYVPRKGEVIPIENGGEASENQERITSNSGQQSTGQINLNTATLEQLKQLDGVGEKKAQKIVDYRQQHGGFKSTEELKNVDGIGEKSYQKLASQVCV